MNEPKTHAGSNPALGGLKSVDGKPIPLREVSVTGDVIGGTARIRVRQRYENVEKEKIEAIYVFPLPTESSISGLRMECDGRTIEGVVKEREDAFKAYDDATLEGHGAALLEQERANVFTATVGNLLPGETTVVEIEYVQRLHAHEGALRVMIPTLVAPRYIPGAPSGDRTAHGAAEPTDRVPDADRISPKIGKTDYTFGLDLALHVGEAAEISSPSHAIEVRREGPIARVAIRNVPLDRDVVILAEGTAKSPVQAIVTHRAGETGTFVFSRLIDLFDPKAKVDPLDVVFVLDRSGSMGGTSIEEARKALRLCLRQLREGDRFSIIAFDDQQEVFAKVPYTQKTLEQADRWIAAVEARGGTELLAPLTRACEDAADGVVVLLTDGQVGNEDEILAAVMNKRKPSGAEGVRASGPRVYAFGIGTNVSDALLSQLARRTGGGLEMIHPGERIDDKVVATFSRAIATRVRDVKVKLVNVDADELAPMTYPDLVDGEPWALFGRYTKPGRGRLEIRGILRGEAYLLEVPIELAESSDQPSVEKLWAAERVRDLESMEVEGRRAKTMKDRIVAIATTFGIASRYTSFIAIEKRTGDRRVPGAADARPIPVNAPAGWAMFQAQPPMQQFMTRAGGIGGAMPTGAPMAMPAAPAPGFAPPPPMSAAAPAPARAQAKGSQGMFQRAMNAIGGMFDSGKVGAASESERLDEEGAASESERLDPIFDILQNQLANGLFGSGDDNALATETTNVLERLLDHKVDAAHALHGELVKKAIVALLALVPKVKRDIAEKALAVAYRAAAGKRTRALVLDAAQQAKIDLGISAHT